MDRKETQKGERKKSGTVVEKRQAESAKTYKFGAKIIIMQITVA